MGNPANTTVMTVGSDTFIRTVNPAAGDPFEAYYYEDLAGLLDPKTNGGAAMEIRFRKNSGAQDTVDMIMSDPLGTSPGGGTYRFAQLFLSTSNVTYQGVPAVGSPQSGAINENDWTILRIESNDLNYTLFKDGVALPQVYPVAPDVLGSNDKRDGFQFRFFVPDGSSFDLDWVRWTNGVPEPTTFGLLALGGLLLMMRRRRR